ncbi:MAG TPA: hypothetical protein PKN48_14520 [Bacteroidales bacterium]|nr:hypothetical protein [Bacteroidales bacterium]
MTKKISNDPYFFSNKIIFVCLLAIWCFILIFGAFTLIQPKWLVNLSDPGRTEEASVYIKEGNKLMYENGQNSPEKCEKALYYYQKSLEIDSSIMDTWANIGVVYMILNRLDEAKLIFEKCLKMDTGYQQRTYIQLADVYERKGQMEKALEYYLASAGKDPYNPYTWRKAGLLSMQLANFDTAVTYLERSAEMEKSFENFYKARLLEAKFFALARNDMDDFNIIIKELQKTDFTADLRRYDKNIFEQTRQKSKDLGFVYMYLGDAWFNKSAYTKAIENYRLSMQYYPAFTDQINYKLGVTFEKMKK